jgi:hypothetical protein
LAYLDKGFSRVEIFWLSRRHRIPYVIPIPLRGQGLKVRQYRMGRRSDMGGVVGVCGLSHRSVRTVSGSPTLQLALWGLKRFHQMYKVRARTTSRPAGLRHLLLGLALPILNCHLTLHLVWNDAPMWVLGLQGLADVVATRMLVCARDQSRT